MGPDKGNPFLPRPHRSQGRHSPDAYLPCSGVQLSISLRLLQQSPKKSLRLLSILNSRGYFNAHLIISLFSSKLLIVRINANTLPAPGGPLSLDLISSLSFPHSRHSGHWPPCCSSNTPGTWPPQNPSAQNALPPHHRNVSMLSVKEHLLKSHLLKDPSLTTQSRNCLLQHSYPAFLLASAP